MQELMEGSKTSKYQIFKEEVAMISEERIIRIEERLSDVSESMVRLEEQTKRTHELLVQHDTAGAKALAKANALDERMDAHEAMVKVPLKWLTLLAKIATAVAAIYGVLEIIKK